MSDPSNVKQIAAKLHRTSDGLNPAIREAEDRAINHAQKRVITSVTVLNAVANLVLAIGLVFALWFVAHVAPRYFAIDHGRLIRLYPLDDPYRSPADVIDFAKKTVDRTFALDFSNYHMELEDVRERYTQDGFKNLIDGLKKNGILDMIVSKRMNLTSSTGTGVLIEQGPDQGVYAWVVRFPLSLKLVGQNTEMPEQHLMATVRIRRVTTLDSVEGIGTAEIVTTPM